MYTTIPKQVNVYTLNFQKVLLMMLIIAEIYLLFCSCLITTAVYQLIKAGDFYLI